MIILPLLCLLAFSLYALFTSPDAVEFSRAMLRVSLSLLALVAARESFTPLIPGAVLLFAVIAVVLLVVSRGEVQLDHDES